MARSGDGDGRHPLTRYQRKHGEGGMFEEYVGKLRVSNCPSCGRVQYTPRGEPMMCPKCTSGKESLARPSVPMQLRGRRRRRS